MELELFGGNDESKLFDKVDLDLHNARKIYLNEQISAFTINNVVPFIEHINYLDKDVPVEDRKPIELIINSPGGSFHDGVAVVSAIERSKTPVYGLVYSYAYSMGLGIHQVCDKRYMSKYGSLLYHGVSTEYAGNGRDLDKVREDLNRIQKIYDSFITKNSNVTQERLEEALDHKDDDWLIEYEEAVDLGLVDGAVEDL